MPDQAFLHLLLVATLPEVPEEQTAFLENGMEICLRQETERYLSTVRERFVQAQKADHQVSLTSSLHFSCDWPQPYWHVPNRKSKKRRLKTVAPVESN